MALDPDFIALSQPTREREVTPSPDPDFDALSRPPEQEKSQWEGVPEPSALARLGLGMLDIPRGLKQMYLGLTNPEAAKQYQQEVESELDIYRAGRGPDAGIDWLRAGGQAAALLPMGAVAAPARVAGAAPTLAQRAAASGLTGTVGGMSLYTSPGESRLANTIMGTVGGAAVPLAFSGATKLAGSAIEGGRRQLSRLAGRVEGGIAQAAQSMGSRVANELRSQGINFAELAPRLQQDLTELARAQLSGAGAMDAAALARKARASQLGFEGVSAPTSAQLTRSPKQWAQERNLQKIEDIGDPITERFTAQDEQFMRLRGQVVPGETIAEEPFDTGASVVDAVRAKWSESQQRVGALYNEIREKYGNQAGITPDNMLIELDDLDLDIPNREITQSVRNRLNLLIREGKDEMTVREAEGLRKAINRLPDKNDPNLMRVKRRIIDSLDNDVIDGTGDDVFIEARAAARARFDDFASKITNDIVEGRLAPDKTFAQITRANVDDLQRLRTNLQETEAGRQAWDRVRQQVLSQLWQRGARQGERSEFRGEPFQKMLRDTIGQRRLEVLFDADERATLNAIAETGMDLTYTPPRAPVNWSGTTPLLYSLMQRGGRFIPGVGDQVASAAREAEQRAAARQALSGTAFDPGLVAGSRQARAQQLTNLISSPIPLPVGQLPSVESTLTPLSAMSAIETAKNR